jgi:hypothetical protein
METVYCEFSPSGRRVWFTYSDGDRVLITERCAQRMIDQGAKLVRFY